MRIVLRYIQNTEREAVGSVAVDKLGNLIKIQQNVQSSPCPKIENNIKYFVFGSKWKWNKRDNYAYEFYFLQTRFKRKKIKKEILSKPYQCILILDDIHK